MSNKRNRNTIDPLVSDAISLITRYQNNTTLFGCFDKSHSGRLKTIGIYNSNTKKYSIHNVNRFTERDYIDLEKVAKGIIR